MTIKTNVVSYPRPSAIPVANARTYCLERRLARLNGNDLALGTDPTAQRPIGHWFSLSDDGATVGIATGRIPNATIGGAFDVSAGELWYTWNASGEPIKAASGSYSAGYLAKAEDAADGDVRDLICVLQEGKRA